MRTLLLPILCLLFAAPLLAQPAEPEADLALQKDIEQLVVTLSRDRRVRPPEADPRLSRAAAALAPFCDANDTPPGGEVVAEALQLAGLVEPAPALFGASFSPGQEAALFSRLRRSLSGALAKVRYHRLGVGTMPLGAGRTRVLVVLLESFVELEPDKVAGPRWEVPPGIEGVRVRGRILPPYARPQVLTTEPGGQDLRLPLSGDGPRFEARLLCQVRGRYQIEVIGQHRYGPTVLANFPVYCGVPAPRELAAARPAADPPFRDSDEAEQQIFALLNGDRARFGLPPLLWDARLAGVARAHSADMRARKSLDHISPTTGDVMDRARRARIPSTQIQENLARGSSPRETERALMDSPGHRAAILSREVSHVGVGVQIATEQKQGGARVLWVTQLFALPAEPFDALKAPELALARLQALRHEAGLAPFLVDPTLTALAQRAAADLGQGRLREEQIGLPVQQAMRSPAMRFRAVRTVLTLTSDLRRMTASRSILDPAITHLGLGLALAPDSAPAAASSAGRGLASTIYVVLVLATDAHAQGAR